MFTEMFATVRDLAEKLNRSTRIRFVRFLSRMSGSYSLKFSILLGRDEEFVLSSYLVHLIEEKKKHFLRVCSKLRSHKRSQLLLQVSLEWFSRRTSFQSFFPVFYPGVFFKEEETLCAIPIPLNPVVLVSRLPKALFRELNGRCSYQKRIFCRNHQIYPDGPPQRVASSKQVQSSFNEEGGRLSAPFGASTQNEFYLRINFNSWSANQEGMWPVLLHKCERNEPVTTIPSTKGIGQSRLPRYLFTEVVTTRVKESPRDRLSLNPSEEGSLGRLRNPIMRDRYQSWNSRLAYRTHPYFSANLRYVC
jgi:hypothetical protein